MDPLDQFESDQRILNELKDLFEFVPPAQIRRGLIDLLFTHITSDNPCLPAEKDLLRTIYCLINFLHEVESQNRF